LGLNCSFGAAESGRLEKEDLFLRQQNPIGYLWKHFDFSSSDSDSWIGYLRPKTGVAGMWWLWPETVKAIENWLEDRPETETLRIVVTSSGKSLYRDESKNAQSGFQARWDKLLNRARAKDTSLPELPFGSLRDQFSDWLVYKHKSETASIALAHGTPFKDDLMLCYAKRSIASFCDPCSMRRRSRSESDSEVTPIKNTKAGNQWDRAGRGVSPSFLNLLRRDSQNVANSSQNP
jgi:hypothetical protein